MPSWSVWTALGFGAFLCASALWIALHPPQKLSWQPHSPPSDTFVPFLNREWLELVGLPLTPRQLHWISIGFGIIMAVVITAVTYNPLVAAAFGVITYTWPTDVIRWIARKRWIALDLAAFGAANTLTFFLERHQSVLPSLREIIPQSDPPFKAWGETILALESSGAQSLESAWKTKADRIHHIELSLIADILAVERTQGNTKEQLTRAVDLWARRVRADGIRRGRLNTTAALARSLTMAAVVGFWLIVWRNPIAAQNIRHGAGVFVIAASAWIIAAATIVQQHVVRQAERV